MGFLSKLKRSVQGSRDRFLTSLPKGDVTKWNSDGWRKVGATALTAGGSNVAESAGLPALGQIDRWNGKDWGAIGNAAAAFSTGGTTLDLGNNPDANLATGFENTGLKSKTNSGADPGSGAPTIDETNDPALANQFKRMRAAARALGRAGTIGYKGAANLGAGATLGQNLTLSGSTGAMA